MASNGARLHIAQYWDAAQPPDYIAALFTTFAAHNPDACHTIFDESSAESLIGSSFGEREAAAFRACSVPAMQADYFRYCAVLARGGVYSDADYRCVADLRPLVADDGTGQLFCRPESYPFGDRSAQRVLNGFFAFQRPGHPLLRIAVDIATANVEARVSERIWPAGEMVRESIWLTVGPGIFTLMHFLYLAGSFDRLLGLAKGTAAEPFLPVYCEVIGDYDRLAAAFDGVRVSPFDDMWRWIAHPEDPLPYKQGDRHWKNVSTGIFR